jgi:hypothetical protein
MEALVCWLSTCIATDTIRDGRLQLGGRPPTSLEVKNPTLNATLTIDAINDNEIEKVYDTFSCENVVRSCIKAFSSVPDWSSLIQREISNGKKLALAWRVDANLDWVWLETDVNEEPRKWAVLCGFVARKVCLSNLFGRRTHLRR